MVFVVLQWCRAGRGRRLYYKIGTKQQLPTILENPGHSGTTSRNTRVENIAEELRRRVDNALDEMWRGNLYRSKRGAVGRFKEDRKVDH